MKTFIRRPGNKSNHLRYIVPLLPKELKGCYIEPFLGSGALFLHLLPSLSKWIVNDLNMDIINIWKLVRDNPGLLLNTITQFKQSFMPLSIDEKLKLCKELTSKLLSLKGNDRTSLYLILVYCCISGVIERNNKFAFNSLHWGLYNNSSVHLFTDAYQKKIKELSPLLKKGKIYNYDYKKILEKAQKGDFVFLDPPYIEDKVYAFQYIKQANVNNSNFNSELTNELEKLNRKGVKWLMTQIDTPETKALFGKYKSFQYTNLHAISRSKKGGKKEIIYTNYNTL